MRFCQELVLGTASVRAIEALGIEPATWHVNEGHAAMSILERMARQVEAGHSLETASINVKRRTAFTLHTPVPAGNETFDYSMVEKYLSHWPERVGVDIAHLRNLGSSEREGDDSFDLGALAIKHAALVNGVSKKHAEVASRDWEHLLNGEAIAVTNGVHPATWVGNDTSRLLTTTLGSDWENRLVRDPSSASMIMDVSDEDMWERRQDAKNMLARFVRERMRAQGARHGQSPDELRSVGQALPPSASRSDSRDDSPRTNGRRSCSTTLLGSSRSSPTPNVRFRWFSPARLTPPTAMARA